MTRGHEVQVTVPDDLPAVWLDPVEIGEVLYNLVENATKYAPPGTQIAIDVRRDGSGVDVLIGSPGLDILDGGPGDNILIQ